jgi:hypothetical protein
MVWNPMGPNSMDGYLCAIMNFSSSAKGRIEGSGDNMHLVPTSCQPTSQPLCKPCRSIYVWSKGVTSQYDL